MSITKDIKAELGRRVETATEVDFLDARIRPYLNGSAIGRGDWKVRVVQLDSTGAATVELRHSETSPAVYAKFFPPGTEGLAIYEKLLSMRESGLGAGSSYQVVEPLGYLPELDLLICKEAQGPSAAQEITSGDDERTLHAVRESAVWLGTLHGSGLRIGAPHSLLVSTEILSLTRRMSKVAMDRPDYVPEALDRIEQLEKLALTTVDGLQVQSHGQYRPIHVFLGAPATTVIDLDRSRPSDPARDTAEYLHRLRRQLLGARRAEMADTATRLFLAAYRATVPDAEAWTANLRFHWARYVFHSMNRKLKKGATDEDMAVVDAYRADFDDLVGGGLL